MTEPHPRWSRATRDHVQRARVILLEVIKATGKPLDGGVDALLVAGLPMYDLLDLAQEQYDKGATELSSVLEAARTPKTPSA